MKPEDLPLPSGMPWCEECWGWHHTTAQHVGRRRQAADLLEAHAGVGVGYIRRAWQNGLRYGLVLGGILGASIAWAVWSRMMGCE